MPHFMLLAGNEKKHFDLAQHAFKIQLMTNCHPGWPMDRFIRRENVSRFRKLRKNVADEVERQRILKLLAEEQQKQKGAGDKIED